MRATEYVILVDSEDKAIGSAEKLHAHRHGLLHRAFSIFLYRKIIQADNTVTLEWLLQQRALDKYHAGGLWTNTCCSHPRPGEDICDAARRRLMEEMGISHSLMEVGTFTYRADFGNSLIEHEIDHVFIGEIPFDLTFTPDQEEVMASRFVSTELLQSELDTSRDKFTPWFEEAFKIAYEEATPIAP